MSYPTGISADADADQRQATYEEFNRLVNLAPKALEQWLDTDESKSVGWKGDDGKGTGESVGHESGRRIVAIKHTNKADLKEEDYNHMRKVCGYIKRHSAQRPDGDVTETHWRYSLMNWGHDPLEE